MKALTLIQPWATLIAIGAKRIETRSWYTSYRGPLAIHAGKNEQFVNSRCGDYICNDDPFHSVLMSVPGDKVIFPIGAIIATCELVRVRLIHPDDKFPSGSDNIICTSGQSSWRITEQEKAFGDYTPGRYMWFLDNVVALPKPIPAAGKQGLWDWDDVA